MLHPDGQYLGEQFQKVAGSTLVVPPNGMVALAGNNHRALVVRTGFIAAARILANGTRQIADFFVPGDIIMPTRWSYDRSPWSLSAVGGAALAGIPDGSWQELTRLPGMENIVQLLDRIDVARLLEHLTDAGRRDSLARLAHLLCEFWIRLEQAKLIDEGTANLPLTQTDLGDATALTSVHVNRTVQRLRRETKIALHGSRLGIPNFEDLARMANFDPAYLLV